MVGTCSCTPVHTSGADANITYLIRGHCREPHLPGQPAGCSGDEGCPTPCAGGGADLHVQHECAHDRSSHCQHEDGHGRDGSIYGGADCPSQPVLTRLRSETPAATPAAARRKRRCCRSFLTMMYATIAQTRQWATRCWRLSPQVCADPIVAPVRNSLRNFTGERSRAQSLPMCHSRNLSAHGTAGAAVQSSTSGSE